MSTTQNGLQALFDLAIRDAAEFDRVWHDRMAETLTIPNDRVAQERWREAEIQWRTARLPFERAMADIAHMMPSPPIFVSTPRPSAPSDAGTS